jgi:hypothetical protein
MDPSGNTLNTFHGPYRTAEAISRAPFADFIPLTSSNRNINAVHPIPVAWLRDELLPRERDNVREHVASLLSGTHPLVPAFVEALQTTMENLDNTGVGRSLNLRDLPHDSRGRLDDDVDGLANQFRDLNTGRRHSGGRPQRSVQFAEELEMEGAQLSSSNSVRSTVRPTRVARPATAHADLDFGGRLERRVRENSQDRYRNELAALQLQLDEYDSIAPTSTYRSVSPNRPTHRVAEARAQLSRLEGVRQLWPDDVEVARALVESVNPASRRPHAAEGRTRPNRPAETRAVRSLSIRQIDDFDYGSSIDRQHDQDLDRPSLSSPRAGGSGHRRAASNSLRDYAERSRRAMMQENQRYMAYARGQFPVWRSPPIVPQRGDGLEMPDGQIRRLSVLGTWLTYCCEDEPMFFE